MQSEKEVVENQFSMRGMPKTLGDYVLAAAIVSSLTFVPTTSRRHQMEFFYFGQIMGKIFLSVPLDVRFV
jgi:hypothetical protein